MITVQDRKINVSVRNFVEFLLRTGDIDNRTGGKNKEAMQAGTRIHKKIQRQMGATYQPEVYLTYEIEKNGFCFCIEGRADGIQEQEDGTVLIDEIKGVYRPLEWITEPVVVHQAQAMCYGYMYAKQNDKKEVTIQMTYCQLESEEIKRFQTVKTIEELEQWFFELLEQYLRWGKLVKEKRERRNHSIQPLQFPFPYRKGQRDIVVSVYRTIIREKKLFLQAPTGVGKTMSTMFPSIKALGEGKAEKIFYVTAKTITRTVAYQSIQILRDQGLKASVVILTAKEKLCPMEEMNCNPVNCPYAKGHFERVNEALYELLVQEDEIERETLRSYAEKFFVCPFELGLDASSFSDIVIADYNYVFDPNVHLRRFFSENQQGNYIFLIDEAHNLVDRAREMYSAILYREDVFQIKTWIKSLYRKFHRYANQCINAMDLWEVEWREQHSDGRQTTIGTFYETLTRLFLEIGVLLEEEELKHREEIVLFYLNLRHFLNMYEMLDDTYEIYVGEETERGFFVKLFCVTPANQLKQYLDKGMSSIFFSATILPIQYYREMLSNEQEDYAVYIPSPFQEEKRLLAIGKDVTSRYNQRNDQQYERIVWYMDQIIDGKRGNYMVFFPSYQYMKAVYDVAMERGLYYKAEILIQQSEMKEVEKEDFLQQFKENGKKAILAFCVIGGMFSEGIDLVGEQLIGVIIVGTGLPKVCQERELLKQHYEEKGYDGFEYAYRYPAMNKVLQAAGRVIRTEEDRGSIVLLDDRFLYEQYQQLFPREWTTYQMVTLDTVQTAIKKFWEK